MICVLSGVWAECAVQIMYFGGTNGASEKLYVYSGERFVRSVKVEENYFSDTIKVKGPSNVLVLADQELTEVEQLAKYPSVNVPKGWKKILLIGLADPKKPDGGVRFLPINATAPYFQPGDLMFFNFGSYTMEGKVGNQSIRLMPKKKKIVKKCAQPGKDYEVQVDLLTPNKYRKRQSFIYQYWNYSTEKRTLIFVSKLEGTTRNKYTVSEVVGL